MKEECWNHSKGPRPEDTTQHCKPLWSEEEPKDKGDSEIQNLSLPPTHTEQLHTKRVSVLGQAPR